MYLTQKDWDLPTVATVAVAVDKMDLPQLPQYPQPPWDTVDVWESACEERRKEGTNLTMHANVSRLVSLCLSS